jgi:hypothetical protein
MADPNPREQERLHGLGRLGFAQVDLLVTDGPDKGRRFPLRAGENIIGRSPETEVTLEEGEVSRRHARIRIDQEIELEDLGSAVGTILNGRMMMGRDFVFDNDEIRIGPYTLRLELKRQESRRGILVAAVCLGVAVILVGLATLFPEQVDSAFAQPARVQAGAQTPSPATAWRNWENLHLPDREALEDLGLEITATAAEAQYNFATRLYDDRFGDLGNAYQALLYYKRALAILQHVRPLERRPAIAYRSLERVRDLQEMIRQELEKRVFAFRRYYHQRWWRECFRALNEMTRICPWERGRFHGWAAAQHRDLRRMLAG